MTAKSLSATACDLQRRVDCIERWFHSIDLGHGVVTPGLRKPEMLLKKLEALHLPNLEGKTVLDIGAWDGYYSFEAEKRGARGVVALDHHAWALNRKALAEYNKRCQSGEVHRQPLDRMPELWLWDELPGRRGFDLARETLGSQVVPITADFMTTDLTALGLFDVVLYLGVLYHIESPLLALQRLREVTKTLAVLETEAVEIPGQPDVALCEFFSFDNPLRGDATNFWAPNAAAMVGMGTTAGFRHVDILSETPVPNSGERIRYRLVAHLHA